MRALLEPFISYKYLLFQLTQREIRARYKQSILGYAWVIFNPLSLIAVYTFVFSQVFRFPTADIPYPLFLFSALLPWIFLQTAITTSTQSLVVNSSLLKKVAFPREIIPYSVVLSKLVDFLFASIILIALFLLYAVPLTWQALLFIPLFMIQIVLVAGVSLILSAINLFFRDVQYLANLGLLILMYMSPVVYPVSLVPAQFHWLYKLNPLVGLVEAYRAVLFGYPIEWTLVAYDLVIAVALFAVSYAIFKKTEGSFADIV